MTPETILYRLSVLISEGYMSMPEAECYMKDRVLFSAWLSEKWLMRASALHAQMVKDIAAQEKKWQELRPQIAERCKGKTCKEVQSLLDAVKLDENSSDVRLLRSAQKLLKPIAEQIENVKQWKKSMGI